MKKDVVDIREFITLAITEFLSVDGWKLYKISASEGRLLDFSGFRTEPSMVVCRSGWGSSA